MSIGGAYLCSKSMLNFANVETSIALWFLFSTIFFILFFLGSGNLGTFMMILRNYKSLVLLSSINSFTVLLMCYATEQTEATNVAFMLQFIRGFSVVDRS